MAFNRRDVLLRGGATAAALTAGGLAMPDPASAQAERPPRKWHREADVVVIGSGATGPARRDRRARGRRVGDHGRGAKTISAATRSCSGGNIAARRRHQHPEESTASRIRPTCCSSDLTDWSVVQPNGFPDYRYNDREIIRAFADNSAPTFEFLLAHGVMFVDKAPDAPGRQFDRQFRAARQMHCCGHATGRRCRPESPPIPSVRATLSSGNGLMRPLEARPRRRPACRSCSNTA